MLKVILWKFSPATGWAYCWRWPTLPKHHSPRIDPASARINHCVTSQFRATALGLWRRARPIYSNDCPTNVSSPNWAIVETLDRPRRIFDCHASEACVCWPMHWRHWAWAWRFDCRIVLSLMNLWENESFCFYNRQNISRCIRLTANYYLFGKIPPALSRFYE